jgi:hypothetical protein
MARACALCTAHTSQSSTPCHPCLLMVCCIWSAVLSATVQSSQGSFDTYLLTHLTRVTGMHMQSFWNTPGAAATRMAQAPCPTQVWPGALTH